MDTLFGIKMYKSELYWITNNVNIRIKTGICKITHTSKQWTLPHQFLWYRLPSYTLATHKLPVCNGASSILIAGVPSRTQQSRSDEWQRNSFHYFGINSFTLKTEAAGPSKTFVSTELQRVTTHTETLKVTFGMWSRVIWLIFKEVSEEIGTSILKEEVKRR